MENVSTAIKVGLITIVALGIFFYSVFQVSDGPSIGSQTRRIVARFDDAKGLIKKSRVQVSGIAVGTIDDILLDGVSVKVLMDIRKDLVLYRNARAKKIQESLMGTSLIEIWPGTPDAGPMPEGGEITLGSGYVSMEELMNQFGAIGGDVKAITANVRTAVGATASGEPGSQLAIEQILVQLAGLTEKLNRTMGDYHGDIGAIITNASRLTGDAADATEVINREVQGLHAQVREIVENMAGITRVLRGMVEEQQGGVRRSVDNVANASDKLDALMTKMDTLLDNLGTITTNIKDGKGTVGKLVTDDAIAEDAKYITSKARSWMERADNIKLIFDLETVYYPMQEAGKTYVHLQLRPNRYKYYLFGVVADSWGNTKRKTVTRETDTLAADGSVAGTTRTREYTKTTEFPLEFTLLYGRGWPLHKWFVPWVYFGLIENSGGAGLELSLFEDWWRIETQFNEFRMNELPRWKVQTAITFWEHMLYITAGLDDMLHRGANHWFVGGGIQFNDDDLKLLFTMGAGSAASAIK